MEKIKKSDRDRIYYKVQFIRRNEHYQKCYEGLRSLLIPDEHGELKEITKDKRLIARAKSLYNEFSKRVDEFYPFDLDDLTELMKAQFKGKWTVPAYNGQSPHIIFLQSWFSFVTTRRRKRFRFTPDFTLKDSRKC